MSEAEEIAWAQEVFGEAGPHVRQVAPRILVEAHAAASTHHVALGLSSDDAYGLLWLKLPDLLVSELEGVAGVQLVHPPGSRLKVPVINDVPLVGWRYSKRSTTDIERVPFGRPVSRTRRLLFEPDILPPQLPLDWGEAGLGTRVVTELPQDEQEEISRLRAVVHELVGDQHRVAVLGFASNPNALLRAHLGYATLGENDYLQWEFRREIQLPRLAQTTPNVPSPRPAAKTDDAFDSGSVEPPALRPRKTGKSDAS